ncbi:AAA family ATPase [Robertmurraya yapensis]|uniref:AAA family ATPase n=1 Tax=Bacillus yapensis TaxID=2492960 RepID=A0A431WJ60_9BACI|nr:AAA family ATPase [Bacillus yapensis]RTR35400.1 AAA family ATPase [Bacillus yapensis]TKS97909.1 AAA family ATPase [Bacillus yapensis]
MENNRVYIISGPAGVGKSTTSKELVKSLNRSAYISGDYVSHMHINGRKKPWESEDERSLLWNNILSLTTNFINYDNDVVIDYVTFPEEAKWINEKLKHFNVEVKYVVLLADKDTLVKRDSKRNQEDRMGERSLVLLKEFIESEVAQNHIIDTTVRTVMDLHHIINDIIHNPRFILD